MSSRSSYTTSKPSRTRSGVESRTPALPAAVLWDMDGTLIDTEPYWIATEQQLVESFGGTWSQEHAHSLVGNALLVSAEYIRRTTPVDLPALEIVHRLQAGVMARLRDEVPWRPGALDLLTALGEAGVDCALVTMSWRLMVDTVVELLPAGTFAAVVTGDEVTRGKPDPQPYLLAAEALGHSPRDCVAIEDSPTGAASASTSGARTIVVPHVVDVPPRPGLTFLDTLVGVGPTDLLALTHAG